MRIMNKLKVFLSLDLSTLQLFMEAYVLMGIIRFKLLYRPFSAMAPSLGDFMKETDEVFTVSDKKTLVRVRQAVHIMCKYTFWESKCLVRAVAAMRMLERRGIASTLYLGTAKDEDGALIAHAWLRSGPLYVTGSEEMPRFTVTGTFAKQNRLRMDRDSV